MREKVKSFVKNIKIFHKTTHNVHGLINFVTQMSEQIA